MALSQQNLMKMYGLTNIGGGLAGLFGDYNSPADAANQYLNQIPGQAGQYLDPYLQAGQQSLGPLQQQYGELLGNPGQKLNQIGGSFQQSPGFKFALEQALGAANRSAAAGGMAGSPMSQQQNMGIATGLANQDFYNWLQGATGLYGKGLEGQQGLAGMGQRTAQSMSDLIAQQLAQQAANKYQETAAKNESSPFGSILGGIGSLLGAFF